MSKLAVVTWGTRGIGKAITIALRDRGFTVVANFYSDELLILVQLMLRQDK